MKNKLLKIIKKSCVVFILSLLLTFLIGILVYGIIPFVLIINSLIVEFPLFILSIPLSALIILFWAFYLEERGKSIFLLPLITLLIGLMPVFLSLASYGGDSEFFIIFVFFVWFVCSILTLFLSVFLYFSKRKFKEKEITFYLYIVLILLIIIAIFRLYQISFKDGCSSLGESCANTYLYNENYRKNVIKVTTYNDCNKFKNQIIQDYCYKYFAGGMDMLHADPPDPYMRRPEACAKISDEKIKSDCYRWSIK